MAKFNPYMQAGNNTSGVDVNQHKKSALCVAVRETISKVKTMNFYVLYTHTDNEKDRDLILGALNLFIQCHPDTWQDFGMLGSYLKRLYRVQVEQDYMQAGEI